MSTTRGMLREILSLAPSDSLEVELELSIGSPGQRAYAEPEAVLLEALLQTQPWQTLLQRPDGLRIERMATHSVVAVTADEVDLLVGRASRHDGATLLDAREGEALAIALAGATEYAVVAFPDGVAVHRLQRADATPWAPPVRDLGTWPDPEALLEGWSIPEILRWRTARLMASSGPLDQIAVLGTIARLWESADAAERDRALAHPDETPAGRLQRAALACTEAQLGAMKDWVAVEVVQSSADLEQIASADPASVPALTRHLVDRRDTLESISLIASLSGRGAAIPEMLASLDREVSAHLSMLVLDVPSEERCAYASAVAWRQPDAWWAALEETC